MAQANLGWTVMCVVPSVSVAITTGVSRNVDWLFWAGGEFAATHDRPLNPCLCTQGTEWFLVTGFRRCRTARMQIIFTPALSRDRIGFAAQHSSNSVSPAHPMEWNVFAPQ